MQGADAGFYTQVASSECNILVATGSRLNARQPWIVALSAGLLVAGGVALAAKKPKTPNLKEWIQGPVRYLAEKSEVEEFKLLRSDADRILYVEHFWAKRDPHPETMINEARQVFWERVREANELFLDSSRQGWFTDRGKIHILYGPPSEVQEDLHYRPDAATSTGGIIRWIYDSRAGGRKDVDPITVVPFVRGAGGEYKLSFDPKLSSIFFDILPMQAKGDNPVDRWKEVAGVPGRTEMSVMLDLGKLQEVPPQSQILLERIETQETYVAYGLDVRFDRFGHPDHNGEWLVSFSVDISNTAGREVPAVIARVNPAGADLGDGGKVPGQRVLDEASFKIADSDDQRVAQARLRLLPGDYEITVIVADPDTAQTGLLRQNLRLGPLSDRFRFSDVVLAQELESLRYRALTSYDEPYTIGPFRVIPRFTNRFRPGETLQLFYEVYEGSMPLSVSYQVQGREINGEWVDLGGPATQTQEHGSQAWELPTSERWPLGEYRVRVDVSDNAGRLISTEVPFELAAAVQAEGEGSD
jgi:GWxTD domain-containing protein